MAGFVGLLTRGCGGYAIVCIADPQRPLIFSFPFSLTT